jgi:hypothetical protein
LDQQHQQPTLFKKFWHDPSKLMVNIPDTECVRGSKFFCTNDLQRTSEDLQYNVCLPASTLGDHLEDLSWAVEQRLFGDKYKGLHRAGFQKAVLLSRRLKRDIAASRISRIFSSRYKKNRKCNAIFFL